MKLDELLNGSAPTVSEWLSHRKLLHECDCGYRVYDPDAVNEAVQEKFGDRRSDEIYDWACNLSNQFGWLFIETSQPKYDIYHCQHCAGSEFTLMMDMTKIAEKTERCSTKTAKKTNPPRTRRKKYAVFIDESYSNEFPRKPDGSLALAAFIVAQEEVAKLEPSLAKILSAAYRSQVPNEIKYSRLSKRPGLLERVGRGISDLICSLRSSAIISIYVPSEGWLQEPVRAVRALASYANTSPTPADLSNATSHDKVEAAVRESVTRLAQTVAFAVGQFLGSQNFAGEIWLDPRSKKLDDDLRQQLVKFLPLTPIHVPLIPHAGTIVTPVPSSKMPRLGRRIKIKFDASSHKSAGLQIADFLAGDIRTFFADIPEILTDGMVDEPLVNSRIFFPEVFRPIPLVAGTRQKIADYTGASLLPHYRIKLVKDLVSCYTKNGQMRNVNLGKGIAYDLMD
ncbi:MAG TPA: hypothetical protein VMF06_19055 [Candidatus Limnocylindria bacterium]|nr:hypothetical protein [Candidatus Limnocylindria bacterium]